MGNDDYLLKSRVSALYPRRTLKWLHGEVKTELEKDGRRCGCLHNFYKSMLGTPLTRLTESELVKADEILRQYEKEQKIRPRKSKEKRDA